MKKGDLIRIKENISFTINYEFYVGSSVFQHHNHTRAWPNPFVRNTESIQKNDVFIYLETQEKENFVFHNGRIVNIYAIGRNGLKKWFNVIS